ncbi:hypothetical protein [Nocardia implantans]|uniref:Secreted protein n=1 Tax=Nocardia implantans TaxID=3108168 RepID=A0ABU6APW1_9NOCA|nr:MULTISPECIES: hypothetical protein [unclassified Nocardia]MBF6189855.1 hypothetical protein [Nocardia beijingensis]MEA3526911.1 hypothetical protein [Nocardia sp. CDC192]MEB3509511.1 hypothetical protein [Nocardia sp. CDC186]
MHTMKRQLGAGAVLSFLAGGLVCAGAGPAAAEPGGCYVDRGVTDAAALCHSGEGASVLEAECLGFFLPSERSTPVFGYYSGFESRQTPVGKPMRVTCVSEGAVGIATLAFIVPATS